MRGLGTGLGLSELQRGRNPFADFALALDFKRGRYWDGTRMRSSLATLSGHSYARTGDKYELNTAGVLMPFAADVPGIVPGLGFWSRGSVTNEYSNSSGAAWSVLGNGVVGASGSGLLGSTSTFISNLATGWGAVTSAGLGGTAVSQGATKTARVFVRGRGPNIGKTVTARIARNGSGTFEIGVGLAVVLSSDWKEALCTYTFANDQTGYRIEITAGEMDSAAEVEVCLPGAVTGILPGPIILTTGSARSVGADALSLASPIAADEDFVWWSSVSLRDIAGTGQVISQIDGGSSNDRIILQKSSLGYARVDAIVGGSSAAAINIIPDVHNDVTVMLRRRAGKWSGAAKVQGDITISSEGEGTFPSGLTHLRVGSNHSAASHANSPIRFVGIRKGTFSDPEIAAVLEAA